MYTRAANVVLTVHATRNLTSLLVAPTNGREVGLVVHKATVEERLDIRVWRLDVDLDSHNQRHAPFVVQDGRVPCRG